MADKAKRPQMRTLASSDKGVLMVKGLIDTMLENPDEVLQMQANGNLKVYKELLRDDQVRSCFQQRRTAVVNSEWIIDAASESPEDEAAAQWLTRELQRLKFDNITNKMLYAVHFGWSVAETIPAVIDGKLTYQEIKVRDRSRFEFDRQGGLYLRKDLGKSEKMPAENFWTFSIGADHDDNPYGEGLAYSLYWPVFFKRNGIKYWMTFLEKFSMPTATVKLNAADIKDEEKREQALDIIDAIQADSGVVIPETFVVELIEATRSGTADYKGLMSAMDSAISKIILSQTMTTDNGSSRSQAEVHESVRDDVIKTDADLLCESFNEQVIARLIAWNFPNANAPKVWRRTEPEADLVAVAERDNKIATLGFEPTDEYIEQTYGVGWRRKQAPEVPQPGIQPLGAEFAELTRVTKERLEHRTDQQELVDAAEYLSTKYKDLYGKKVEQLISYMEETDDTETFKAKLLELMEQPAELEQAQIIQNASFFSRLMGYFRGQRA